MVTTDIPVDEGVQPDNGRAILLRISVFAQLRGCSRRTVAQAIKRKDVTTRLHGGVRFVYLDRKTRAWFPSRVHVLRGQNAVLCRKQKPVSAEVRAALQFYNGRQT